MFIISAHNRPECGEITSNDHEEAEGLLKHFHAGFNGELHTVTIKHDGQVIASLSNRLIMGTFIKQDWENDNAIHVATVDFDGTDTVINMDFAALAAVEDSSESSDNIGRENVEWHGPFEVYITNSICEYFGIESLDELTEENLRFVKAAHPARASTEETITLSIKVKVRKSPSAEINDFIENLDYSVYSNTPGVVVLNTEVVGAD